MNRLLLLWVGTLAFVAAGPARAQFTPNVRPAPAAPLTRPPVSPYLDILRGANTPGINYYLGTRSIFNQRTINQQYRTALQDLEQRQAVTPEAEPLDAYPALPSTGHPTAFNYVGSYFNTGSPTVRRPPTQAAPRPRTR